MKKDDPANGGGRISEDNKVALARNGKPSKAYIASLHPATRDDMERLLAAVLQALVAGQEFLTLKTSYLFKWPDDFPVGSIIAKEGRVNYRSLRTRPMLKWFYDKGYTTMTAAKIRGLRHKMGHMINEIEGDT